ncbi:MAG: hypothetical protein PVH30_14415, partial [Desulfobacterales bacterium]
KLFSATSEKPGKAFAIQKDPTGEPRIELPNLERWSLLGSALKRKAALQLKTNASHQAVYKTLKAARDAYAKCEGSVDDDDLNPYAMLNRLQIEALIGEEDRTGRAELARKLKEVSKKRFDSTYDFFDAVMEVDAHVAEGLHSGTLESIRSELEAGFEAAFAKVPGSERMRDSVRRQLELLAGFSMILARGVEDAERQKALRSAADIFTSIVETMSDAGSGASRGGKPAIAPDRGSLGKDAKSSPKAEAEPKAKRIRKRKGKKKG